MANEASPAKPAEPEKPHVSVTIGMNKSSYERLRALAGRINQSFADILANALRLYEALTQEDEQAEYFIRRPGSDELVPLEIFKK